MVDALLDITIGLLLLALAAGAIFSRTLVSCVALFIAFGIVLSLAWARLHAVDLALAEAAIGAGLTGALLLSAVVRAQPEAYRPPIKRGWWVAAGGLVTVLALVFIQALWGLWLDQQPPAQARPSMAILAYQQLEASGVSHPVTAVLLNFRAWDTLLELAVLLVALLGIKQLRPAAPVAPVAPWPLLLVWCKMLAPLLFLCAGYLLWRGSSAPGGAFQAGAVLAAGAILLRLNQLLPPLQWSAWPVRTFVLISLAIFVGVAAVGLWLGSGWLYYSRVHSGAVILLIEIAATVSTGLILTLMVVGDEKDLHA